ncbi:MAG TPA: COX15/CtaA family protein [Steroidobacteraceae bacterium]|jgi:cytochrome c oxidase assembly protein subunit 15|nr:COX15/CtaA family protein [Steroidobacteraceae bacterium]
MPIDRWLRGLALFGVLLCFGVVVLGAYVRLTDAGLGCPDWPGCYGHVSPLGAEDSPTSQAQFPGRPLQSGKAWHEMTHRYAAGTLACVITVIAALTIAARKPKVVGAGFGLLLFATVIVQAILGMLTVTWLLKPLIVTLHLIFGMTTLGLLWWLWLRLQQRPRGTVHLQIAPEHGATRWANAATAARIAYWLAVLGVIVLAVQFFLGGWTSANYAAVACPDFPTCQGAWWPHTDFRHAFVLWHGLWINYEGGVLANPARVAIHLVHRLGALTVTLMFLAASCYVIGQPSLTAARPRAYLVLAALGLQLVIGISMVLQTFPLWLTTAHTAGAALLLMAILALTAKLLTLRAVRTA